MDVLIGGVIFFLFMGAIVYYVINCEDDPYEQDKIVDTTPAPRKRDEEEKGRGIKK